MYIYICSRFLLISICQSSFAKAFGGIWRNFHPCLFSIFKFSNRIISDGSCMSWGPTPRCPKAYLSRGEHLSRLSREVWVFSNNEGNQKKRFKYPCFTGSSARMTSLGGSFRNDFDTFSCVRRVSNLGWCFTSHVGPMNHKVKAMIWVHLKIGQQVYLDVQEVGKWLVNGL